MLRPSSRAAAHHATTAPGVFRPRWPLSTRAPSSLMDDYQAITEITSIVYGTLTTLHLLAAVAFLVFALIIHSHHHQGTPWLLVAASALTLSGISGPIMAVVMPLAAKSGGTSTLLYANMASSGVGSILHWIFLITVALAIAALARSDRRATAR